MGIKILSSLEKENISTNNMSEVELLKMELEYKDKKIQKLTHEISDLRLNIKTLNHDLSLALKRGDSYKKLWKELDSLTWK